MALDEKDKQEWADQLKALKVELTALLAEAQKEHSPLISELRERLEKVTKQLQKAEAQLAEIQTEKETAAKAAKEKADKEARDKEEAEKAEKAEADKAGLSLEAYRQRKKEEEGRKGQQTSRKRAATSHWL